MLRHLLVATLEDADDPKAWSGTAHNLIAAVRGKVERLTLLSAMPVRRSLGHGAIRAVLGPERYPLWRTTPALKAFGAQLDAAVIASRPDAVLAISSQALVHSRMLVPTFMLSDAPWFSWRQTYSQFEPIPWYAARFAALEAAAARRCTGLFFASHFACTEACRLYGPVAPPAVAVPFGANLRPDAGFVFEEALSGRLKSPTIEMLFLGRDWERKGGPLAVATAKTLHDRGHAVRLHVVGCRPPGLDGREHIITHGPLRVDHARERAGLLRLLETCHVLLVPTRAECFGVVFAEAQAFGLVPVTRLVHAAGEIVRDGITGLTMPPEAGPDDYASAIVSLVRDKARYAGMSRKAYDDSQERFIWSAAARSIVQRMAASIAQPTDCVPAAAR